MVVPLPLRDRKAVALLPFIDFIPNHCAARTSNNVIDRATRVAMRLSLFVWPKHVNFAGERWQRWAAGQWIDIP